MSMLPFECLLQRHVRSEADGGLSATSLPLFILECKERKAEGYAEDKREMYNQRVKDMKIGVRLADKPPAVSYLALLGIDPFAEIVAIDKTVIVISLEFPREEGPLSYLIYDAVALSLRMIPTLEVPSMLYPLSRTALLARPCRGPEYALLHTRRMDVVAGQGEYLFMWRPSSSSPRPWSEYKKTSLPGLIDWTVNDTNTEFSFNGHAYWVDLRCGVSYCSSDALFDDNISMVKFGGFIPLPVKPGGHGPRVAVPAAYRTMGVVRDSFIRSADFQTMGDFIRFVSIDGFQDYVQLKDRTVTVWKLLFHDKPWKEEHKFSLEELWGFQGFTDDMKDLTPMYPLLSTENADVIYLVLGEYYEYQFERVFEPADTPLERVFEPADPRYMLAVDMRNKTVRTFVPLEHEDDWFDNLISCGFSHYLSKALVGPCDDKGIPISP